MQLTVIGSGGAIPHPRRGPPAYLLEQGETRILIDAGPGSLGRLAALGVRPADLSAVLLSHLHPDHALEVIPLLFHRSWAPAPQVRPGLRLLGPVGFRAELSSWAEAVYPGILEGTNDDLVWEELADPITLGPWRVTPVPVLHRPDGPSASLGYRIDGDQGRLAFTGDTGPCEALAGLLDPAGCLLCECNAPGEARWHLWPAEIRRLLDRRPPALTLLTHVHEAFDHEPLPGPAFDGYDGGLIVAEDGMVIEWVGGVPGKREPGLDLGPTSPAEP
jgi:ribonuclease BN (tRNA processing enzyme)